MNPNKTQMHSQVGWSRAARYAGLLSLFLIGACGESSEGDFEQTESPNNPTTANGGAANRGGSAGGATRGGAPMGGATSANPASGGTTAALAGTWSGSVSSLGTRVTRTTTFTADGSPIFVCTDGTQTPLTRVDQSFQCVDTWLSGGSDRRLTLVVLRLVRQQTRVEFDLDVQIPGGIRIGTTINGPGTITELGRDVFYGYTFVLNGNQLTYTVENDASNVIESGVLTKR
jgi:hypothetical protein